MVLVILIAALAVVGAVASVAALPKDGYRRTPTEPGKLRELAR